MASFAEAAAEGSFGFSDQMAALYGQSPVTSLRQSMTGSGDILAFSAMEAKLQADIDVYEDMLAETDKTMYPRKIALIKAKLSDLRQQLARAEAGLGSAGAMEAIEADRFDWASAEQSAGRAEVHLDPQSGNLVAYANKPTGTYAQFNLSQYAPQPSGLSEYRPPAGFQPPSWMNEYLAQGGQVRPLGMQDQLGALQQGALWEQQAMRNVTSIEDYMEREPYIQVMGDEMRQRSLALAPQAYNRRSQWEKALQR